MSGSPESLSPEPGRSVLVVSHASVLPVNQEVYRALVERGWDMTLVVPRHWKHAYGETPFNSRPMPELATRFRPAAVLLRGRAQRHVYLVSPRRIVRELAPRALLIEEETFSLAAAQWAFAARRAEVPYGVQAAENLDRRLPWPARLARRSTLPSAAFVMARSPTAATLAEQWGAHRHIEVVPHAVPGWESQVKRRDARYTIGYAGRLVAEKGLHDLVGAAALVPGEVDVLLVGNGPLRAEFERATLPRGRVEVLSGVAHQDMADAYARMDVLVLPSRTTPSWAEQFGRVLIEALWCGVPVVGSDSGEIPWVLETTGGGCIFPEGDTQALAGVLATLRDKPEEASKLAETGRRKVSEHFSIDAVARRLDRLLATAITEHGANRDS